MDAVIDAGHDAGGWGAAVLLVQGLSRAQRGGLHVALLERLLGDADEAVMPPLTVGGQAELPAEGGGGDQQGDGEKFFHGQQRTGDWAAGSCQTRAGCQFSWFEAARRRRLLFSAGTFF